MFLREEFSRKHYLELFRTLSTASRDLKEGIDQGLLLKSGEKALTRYRSSGKTEFPPTAPEALDGCGSHYVLAGNRY